MTRGSYRRFQDSRPLALPQESPEQSRDMPVTHTALCCVLPASSMVYTARRSEMPGSFWLSAEASAKTIHAHIRPVGSIGSAEVPTWCTIDIYDWAKPSRSPIFDVSREPAAYRDRRAGLQRHDRPTVVRRNCHQTRLGNRCNRWSLRALQRACARSCSTSPRTRYPHSTFMGGAAYSRAVSTKDLRGLSVAHGRPTGKPTVEGSEIMM